MAPRSQSKSMRGQSSTPGPCWQPAGAPVQCRGRGLHPSDFHGSRGYSEVAMGSACPECDKHKVTSIRGEIFIHSGLALRAPRRVQCGRREGRCHTGLPPASQAT